jgi:hypothetical protein
MLITAACSHGNSSDVGPWRPLTESGADSLACSPALLGWRTTLGTLFSKRSMLFGLARVIPDLAFLAFVSRTDKRDRIVHNSQHRASPLNFCENAW